MSVQYTELRDAKLLATEIQDLVLVWPVQALANRLVVRFADIENPV